MAARNSHQMAQTRPAKEIAPLSFQVTFMRKEEGLDQRGQVLAQLALEGGKKATSPLLDAGPQPELSA